jgi:hypothetical protein
MEETMTGTLSKVFTTSRGEVRAIMLTGALVIAFTVAGMIVRLIDVLPNQGVPVSMALEPFEVELPLGPGSSMVPAEGESVTVAVSGLDAGTYAAAIGQAIVGPITWIVVTVCVMLVCRSLADGAVFTRANTRRVFAIAVAIVVGWGLDLILGFFTELGTLFVLSGGEQASGATAVDAGPAFAAIAVGAVASAFHAGERLQRDSEGLV